MKIYAENSIVLKAKGYRAHKLHKGRVFKRNFTAWFSLFKYYSNIMRESLAKQNLSRAIFLKKFLVALADYSREHR